MVDEAKCCIPIYSTFEALVCDMQSGTVLEKNWAHPVDQCQLQALLFLCASHRFAEHILRRNGFTRIQKTSGSDQQQTIKQ